MIVLDLEWNRGYDRVALDEILQIGAVRIEAPGGPVLGTFNACIRPSIHKKFDRGAKSLPALSACLTSDLDFVTAANRFRAWCGGETAFALWGDDDLDTLDKNCRHWGGPPIPVDTVYNFQLAFSRLLETEQQIALWRAAEYCRIPDTFEFHNALYDALYTALVGAWLTPEALAYRPPPKLRRRPALRLSRLPFPRQPRQKVGPFPTPAQVLDAKLSRKPACPLCGQTGCVTQWRFPALGKDNIPQQYYAVFSCPEHGRFLCRLALARLEDGTWRGRRFVPELTPELILEYDAALRGGVHVCKAGKRKRRRRQRGQPSLAQP